MVAPPRVDTSFYEATIGSGPRSSPSAGDDVAGVTGASSGTGSPSRGLVPALDRESGMADDQHYDVVIIGTGAGGGTLGHRLASSGAKVLWLERGPFLPRERDNWETQAVFVRGKYLASEVWYDGHGREFQPEVNCYVGG